MKEEYWSKRELEKIYINVIINEEEVYLKKAEEIKKQKKYIMIGLNLKGRKEIIGIYIPEEETTGYWIKEINSLKERGIENIFMVLNNKWLKKVFKMVYVDVIYTSSLIEIYNKTQNYISRKEHRIVIQEINRIYKSESIEEAKKKYYNLKEGYKENKLINYIINKYIKEILEMFKYPREMRIISSNTDTYNKMRNRIRWKIKEKMVFENKKEMIEYLIVILKEEESKWVPSKKNWDKLINNMESDLLNKIIDMI